MSNYQTLLNSLPSDWKTKKITELGVVISGGTPSRAVSSFWQGTTPWLTPGEVSKCKDKHISSTFEYITDSGLNNSGAHLLPEGSLLVTSRATLGARVINQVPMTTNQGFKSIVFEDPKDADYYFHFLSLLKAELERRASGTTFLEISGTEFSDIDLPVPPKNERNKINEILDTLDTQIRETEAIIAKLQQLKQGLLHDLLTRGVAENGELRPSYEEDPRLYKLSELGHIPKGWDVKRIDEISTVRSGSTPLRARAEHYYCEDGGFPWIKTMDLNENTIVKTDERITSKALQETSCSLFPEGSVLVAMYGGWEQIGRTALIQEPSATNQAISVLIFNNVDIQPAFILRALQLNRFRWKRVAASTRKDPNITKSDVELFQVALPQSSIEQEKIVNIYSEMANKLESEKSSLLKLKYQKSGLMDDLLTGKVRVTDLIKQQQTN
ncbi:MULTISPECIES: restriction endonuclease subunit S [Vibrio]|uniref:restriction endonuclease subunit S n=1 Tax=Vibrio TaxID=662 RepID=UPI001B31577C|nr:restriction endonuclease subunit S [Vibrio crassostreae]